ncbi:MAG: OmpA family protein [Desulfuromonadaceae bacterium]|nr:OmpA family protein [Desulfuromonadaceae bacterium]MDD5107418.1 OmpA family protein [Desulfuromonadaceae bacterium]
MVKTARTLLVAGSLLTISAIADAGNKAEQFSVSPVIGGITFDGRQHQETSPLYGGRLGYNFTDAFGVEALFDYALAKGTTTDNKVDFFRYGAEMLYHFMPDHTLVPYVAAGFAAVDYKHEAFTNGGSDPKGAFNYGVGLKYFLSDNMALRGDVRHLIYRNNDDQTLQALEYTVGLYFPFGGKTPVAQPMKPAVAKVEAAPAPRPASVVAPVPAPVAIPAPVVVPAPSPSSSLTVAPASVAKGQPATLSWTSTNVSACQIEPAVGAVQPQGSLKIASLGSTTYTLNCSGPGGTTSSKADLFVVIPVAAARFCQPTVINVLFDTNKSDVKAQYHDELKQLGDFLTEFPNAKGVIEGHTDSVGSKAYNVKLSQSRADSIRAYLIKKFNIARERISAKGYGPDKPVADNKTAAGKQKNRRTEANFICN